jgi:Uma2 family endonuclease
MGMPATVYYTADMVRAMPEDGNRYETVHGELLVTPAPRALHQVVAGRIFVALANYLDVHPVGQAYYSPADISWGPDVLVQPDVFVAARTEAGTGDWARIKTLLLAVEVLSPSSGRADRFTKRRLYQEVGVAAYWVVDADERAVELWTPEARFPVVERERVTWAPAGAAEPLVIELERLFRPV